MQAVDRVFGHDVDPAIGHHQFAILQVELDMFCEGLDVAIEFFLQFPERGGHLVELVEAAVGCVTAAIVFLRPLLALDIVAANLVGFLDEFAIKRFRTRPLERRVVDARWKQGLNSHCLTN